MQLLLPIFPREATLLNANVGVYELEGIVQYLVNGLPVYSHAKDRYIKMLEQGLDEIELSFTYRLGNLLIKPFRYFSRLIMGTIRRKNKTAG